MFGCHVTLNKQSNRCNFSIA